MKRIAIFALLLTVLVAPIMVVAQDPGSGAPIVEGNFSGSVNIGSMNPIRCGGTDCRRLNQLMFPTLVGVDPETQSFGKMGQGNVYGGLATDWTVSDDGLIYTFTLRQDAVWSDGTPITGNDVKFAFDAIASGVIDSTTFSGYVDYSEANPNGVKEIRVIDDFTIEVEFGAAACDALNRVGAIYAIPPAAFGYDGSPDFDFTVMVDNEFDTAPSIAYGPFQFANSNPGEAIGLQTVEGFVDGPVVPAGFIYRDVPDQTVLVEQFLAGESNFIDGAPQASRADIRSTEGVVSFDYPGISWDYVGLNLADPANPQPGADEAGNPIDQGHHPIFGDVRVRRAMQMAIDVPAIVQGAVFGEGTQMAANQIPTSWALDTELAPIAFDAEGAAALLDEAGWVLQDGVRVCDGCMYAEAGSPLEFTLITNQGNTRREAIGQIIQDQLSGLGIVVDFQPIDFNTLIDEVFGKQTFDAYILGWREGFPVDPDQTTLFTPAADDPANTGNNGVSYNNPEVTRLMQEAGSVAGCAQEDRAELYKQIQRILLEDQPYLFLYVINGQYAAPDSVANFSPYPNAWDWNVQTWAIAAE